MSSPEPDVFVDQSTLLTGRCKCGATKIRLNLPEPLESYTLRQCDCDFCCQRGISYLSDPKGVLEITTSHPLNKQRQGSNQAVFLSCANCQQVIAATISLSHTTDLTLTLRGALNAQLIENNPTTKNRLQTSVQVSPKNFSATEKLARWQSMWLNLNIVTNY